MLSSAEAPCRALPRDEERACWGPEEALVAQRGWVRAHHHAHQIGPPRRCTMNTTPDPALYTGPAWVTLAYLAVYCGFI
jgi:hypothetical protein